jgi:hypothetical protein
MLHPVNLQDIWMLSLDEKDKPRAFLQTPFAEGAPAFSPDGRWLACVSLKSGQNEVYVRPFTGSGKEWQVSTDGGNEVIWPRDGHELFYRKDAAMMAVDVKTAPTLELGKPHRLFEQQYASSPALFARYDATADGQRFIMVKNIENASAPMKINIVLNWAEELKRRVPASAK